MFTHSSMAFGGPDKKDILRGVYEDNLRMKGHAVAGAERMQRPLRHTWPGRLAVVLAIVLAVVGGLAFGSTLMPADASSDEAPVAASEPAPPSVMTSVEPGVADLLPAEPLPAVPDAAAYDSMLHNANLPLADLFGLQVRTIVIDPGHGGRDPGAIGVNGVYEKDVVLDVAQRLQRRLSRYDAYRILLTRTTDVKVPLKERVAFANERGADLFVSLHVNDLPDDAVTMVETYYFGPHSDESALRSARRENEDSEYSIADFRDVIQNITGTVRLQESRDLAVNTQRQLVSALRSVNPGLQSWGVKTAPFVVLLGVEAPAILAELSVVSQPDEADRLRTDEHRERLAAALERGLLDYLRQRIASGAPASADAAAHEPASLAHAHGQEAE